MGEKRIINIFLILFFVIFSCGFALAYDWSEVVPKVKAATVYITFEQPGKEKYGINAAIIDPAGIILTNFHVYRVMNDIKNGTDPEIAQGRVCININNQEYDWHLIGADPLNDLALLQIDSPIGALLNFSYLQLEDNINNMKPGKEIMIIGAPMCIRDTLVTGNWGSVVEETPNFPKILIQHSAPTYSGNSGSAVIGTNGKIVGIHESGVYIEKIVPIPGQGHAIPAYVIRGRIPRMESGFKLRNDLMGLSFLVNLKIDKISDESIFKNYLKPLDVIIKIQDTLASTEEFFNNIVQYSFLPGETIVLNILRKGQNGRVAKYKIEVPLTESCFEDINP